jgi:hypothetical protein
MQIQRQSESFAYRSSIREAKRIAALTQDIVDRLHGEFRDWWRSGKGLEAFNKHPVVSRYLEHHNNLGNLSDEQFDQYRNFQDQHRRIKNEMRRRGPIGWWPNVENFLKDNYPAAHRGFSAGLEDAKWSLDYPTSGGYGGPYQTGPEAVNQHGYDPKEIAAGMLLLHNESHPFRGDMAKEDQQRLVDIFQKRQQMQRDYDQNKKLVNAVKNLGGFLCLE